MPEKLRRYKTIEISVETYDELCGFQKQIEAILKHKVGFDKLIRILFALNPTDELVEIYLGEPNK